jgi:hypothetical protein
MLLITVVFVGVASLFFGVIGGTVALFTVLVIFVVTNGGWKDHAKPTRLGDLEEGKAD